jgi:hypothetical protein
LIPHVSIAFVQSKVTTSEGKAETYVEVRTGIEYCGREASPECPLACFVVIKLEGQAAPAIYDAMKVHGTKIDDFSGNPYVGTQSDALACHEEDGQYSCQIGYNVLTNVLTEIEVSDCE